MSFLKASNFKLAVYLMTLLLIACGTQKGTVTKKSIKKSQELIGIEFSKQKIDTLQEYLQRNKKGYDSLRKYPVADEVFPAILFDPIPRGFQIPSSKDTILTWTVTDTVQMPENMSELAFFAIPKLASLIKNKKITCLGLTQFYLDRLKKYSPKLECTITLTEDLALDRARQLDNELAEGHYRGILHGIPYGVKDLMAVEGYPTTWGSEPYKTQRIEETATVVKHLDEAGGILVAKLVSGALARGDVWFGGKTRNPWDTSKGAGGSSAGSGSATSAGLVPFALGTETLGSITSPSSKNGITGLRPTYGQVSRHGVMSLSWSMDKVGPMCRNAEDCAIVFSIIQGKDEKDKTTTSIPFSFNPKMDVKTLKVAYLKDDIEKDTTKGKANLLKALTTFKKMGIEPMPVHLPTDVPYDGFDIILRSESGAFFDELVRSGEVDIMVEQHKRSRANSLRQSRFIPAVEYLQANRHRQILIEKMHQIMKDYDVLISPSFGNKQLVITNLTGHPVIAIPTGLDDEKLPTSLTLVGNLYDEGKILLLAKHFQEVTDYDELHPEGYD
ncbi:amidase family protein [Flagellimonas meridianipacifica]|uniref:Asp-tRNA(Asn)/Glu-tRNA(Gln) amidotransferase A subunit family amidase n=1 Tax=Flagellimonas meridianipacifica TaxID=1080225 RepID=A0A2T0MGZ1_9FLAO|nr:amidase family protein [Allomuricauda pacifica]PRX56843.1 Asp-tRNA(Asn)/Glu-tRNA(Gln) amidotransferase A subunit family amidase [Allomuricauda pacifica]